MTAGLTDKQVYSGMKPKFPSGSAYVAPVAKKASAKPSDYVKAAQTFLNSRSYPSKDKGNFDKLTVDGFSGPKSLEAALRILQYFGKVEVDGVWGPKTEDACLSIERNSPYEWWSHLAQAALNLNGASLKVDGVIGSGTESAIKSFQKSNGLKADGIIGALTWEALLD